MSGIRKVPLVNGHYYHIISRSIAQYKVFDEEDYSRFLQIVNLYRYPDLVYKYSNFIKLSLQNQKLIIANLGESGLMFVTIIAYCVMPTHIHLLLKQNLDHGISNYLGKILNSYTRYFNIKHHRKGPLWEGRFKNVLVDKDEQILHLTRYIHLNPASAGLVDKPDKWSFSSYGEYINNHPGSKNDHLCDFDGLINLDPTKYKKFVQSRIAYQKELSKIKHLLIENYNG